MTQSEKAPSSAPNLTLAEWREQVGASLRSIEYLALQARWYAGRALQETERVAQMPPWETRAESGLNEAMQLLKEALRALNEKPRSEA